MPMGVGGGRGSAHGRGEPRAGSVRYGRLKLVREDSDAADVVRGDDTACRTQRRRSA